MKKYGYLMMAGGVLLLIGALIHVSESKVSPYLFLIGSILFAYAQVMGERYDGSNFIIRRLRRQQIFGAMLLVFTGVLMFLTRHNEWIVALTIATVFELYCISDSCRVEKRRNKFDGRIKNCKKYSLSKKIFQVQSNKLLLRFK